jgi:trimethylamine--corrinoid protein Co-methyltransferase
MEVNESDLALEVIEKVGPKGQYLSHPHTLANYRKLHVPKYRDRSSYTAWEASGKKDMLATVQAEVKDILARHRPKPLDKDVELKLAEIEKRASKALA